MRCGMPCLQQRKTERTFTSCTRCHASRVVSVTDPSSIGLMPALLKRTSTRPRSCATCSYIAATCSSSVTSAEIARSPSEASERSTPATFAPSDMKSLADWAPMPLAAPVITQTFPSSLPGIPILSSARPGRVIDVLHLGVGVERVRPELAPDAGLLEAAERRCDAHRGVRVDRDHTGLERSSDPQGSAAVARPDRAGEPVDRVVG